MTAYAIMLAIRRSYGINTFMEPHILDNLQHYFPKAKAIPAFEESCLEGMGAPWETHWSKVQTLEEQHYRRGALLELPQTVSSRLD